jgi:glycerate kinase
MLAALGIRFLDGEGEELVPDGGSLASVTDVDITALTDLSQLDLAVAADVDKPLLGADGAAACSVRRRG